MVDILKTFKDKPDPLRKKAQQIGVPTPQSTTTAPAVGATPKQAQMAASPQSQQAAISQQAKQAQESDQQKQLRTAQLQAQGPREVTGSEDTQTRAAGIINSLANLQGADLSGAVLTGDTTVQAAGTAEDYASQLGGEEAPEGLQAGDLVDESLEGADAAFTVTVSELQQTDPELYAEVLQFALDSGLDPNTATLEDIKRVASDEINEVTAVVDEARETLNDPSATPTQRQQAAQLMRDYGAAHLIATDAELADFEQDLSTVGLLEIDGETYTLEDLADNEAIAATLATAAKALIDDPDATAEDLGLADNPMLYEFVKKHSTAISSVLEEDEKALESAKKQVDTNKTLTDNLGSELTELMGLNPYTMENITEGSPGFKIFTSDEMLAGNTITNDEAREAIKYFSTVNPDMVKQFLNDPKFEDKLPEFVQKANQVKLVNESKSVSDIATNLLGVNSKRLNEVLADISRNPKQYSAEHGELFEILSTGNANQIKEKLASWLAEGNELPTMSGKTYTENVQDNAIGKIKKSLGNVTLSDILAAAKSKPSTAGRSLSRVNSAIGEIKKFAEQFPDNQLIQSSYQRLLDSRKELISANNIWEESERVRKEREKKEAEKAEKEETERLRKEKEEEAKKNKPKKKRKITVMDAINPIQAMNEVLGEAAKRSGLDKHIENISKKEIKVPKIKVPKIKRPW